MRKFPNVPPSAIRGSARTRETAVNAALRRVVNDGVPLYEVLDELFNAGFVSGYQEMGDNVASAAANLVSNAEELRMKHEREGLDSEDVVTGIEQALGTIRRTTGVGRPLVNDDEVLFGRCGSPGCCTG